MELIGFIKRLQAVIYSALINYIVAFSLYLFICRISLEKVEIIIAMGMWFVYFGFIYIFYCLFLLAFPNIRKLFQSAFTALMSVAVICTFYYIVTGSLFHNQRMVVSFILLLLLSAGIPFLISLIYKKLK